MTAVTLVFINVIDIFLWLKKSLLSLKDNVLQFQFFHMAVINCPVVVV